MPNRRKHGVQCGNCESTNTCVVATRHGHQHTLRYRKCLQCGHNFKTYEINQRHLTTDPKFDFLFKDPRNESANVN